MNRLGQMGMQQGIERTLDRAPCAYRRRTALLLALATVLLVGWRDDDYSRAQVTHAQIYPCAAIHCLEATTEYHLGTTLYEALHNGIALVIQTDIEIYRPRRLLWDKLITTQRLYHRLDYHVLSKRYRLRRTVSQSGLLRFSSLEAALRETGSIRALPLPEAARVAAGDYMLMRSNLDIDALPNPLKPMAYLQNQWRLADPGVRLTIR